MESSQAVQFRFRGVGLDDRDVGWLQEVIDRQGSLKAAAAEACSRFGWTRPNGQAPTASCSTMFRRLEERGLLKLPKAPRRPPGSDREHADRQALLEALGPVPGMVECQPEGPVTVRPIAPEERDGFRLHLRRFHYLGFERSVGESLGYAGFVGDELVALLDWGAAALHCEPRDRYIGWGRVARERNLEKVVGNRRFLVLPWVRRYCLASQVLGANVRRLADDWQTRYGHRVLLAETFIDTRFPGTCYRAANWTYLGMTRGFTRLKPGFKTPQEPKAVYVYPLARDAVERLRTSEEAAP
jgi:Druantia protein DruA